MIRVTVELVPHGVENKKQTLRTLEVANDGTGTHSLGNYTYRFRDGQDKQYNSGVVTGFPRRRKGPWHLILKILLDHIAL